MTRKKEKKDAKHEKEKGEIDQKNDKKKQVKESPDIIKERIDAEPDLLEEKEGAEQILLEYYSKEDLVKKVKDYEKELEDKYEKIKLLDEWKNKFTHLQAEFENAQKRWEKNRQDLRIQYKASVLKNFLPLYDSFKKAINSDAENDALTQFYNQFLNLLKSQGVEPINVNINDLFDYSVHEALSSIETDEVPENSIVEIIQDGWKFGKDILRYAKVIISKKPKSPETEQEAKQEEEPTAEASNNEQEKMVTEKSEAAEESKSDLNESE
ncbi:MAG: nucleotide exchange factor GrpE [Candidatus Thorarchaeota archaeon]